MWFWNLFSWEMVLCHIPEQSAKISPSPLSAHDSSFRFCTYKTPATAAGLLLLHTNILFNWCMKFRFLLGGLFWRLQETVGSFAGLKQNVAVTGVAACSSCRVICMHIYAFMFTNCSCLVDLILGTLWVMMYALLCLKWNRLSRYGCLLTKC